MIALLTDFGTSDYFVGAVKGVILLINPNATIIDITHEIPPHDIEAGAFTLLAVRNSFPAHTIFLAVVDPGVGSARRPIVVECGEQLFVGPDNGLFSYACESKQHTTFHLTNESYFRHPVSPTFHGRDVFASVAAQLSMGVNVDALGEAIDDAVRLPSVSPAKVKEHVWKGRIIHIDRFGNCVTNLTSELLNGERPAKLKLKGKTITSFRKFFADNGAAEKVFAVWGSAGFLEIAAQNRSAAKKLKVKRGDVVRLETDAERRGRGDRGTRARDETETR